MIQLEQPSIAVNDFRMHSVYLMWRTLPVRSSQTTRQTIIDYVARYARQTPNEGKIKNLVINSHGFPAYLQLGEGFGYSDVTIFSGWNNLFETIWLMGCLVARAHDDPVPAWLNVGRRTGDGRGFCSRLAHYTNAHVIASGNINVSDQTTYPYGYISLMEGRVNMFEAGSGRSVAYAQNRLGTDNQGNVIIGNETN